MGLGGDEGKVCYCSLKKCLFRECDCNYGLVVNATSHGDESRAAFEEGRRHVRGPVQLGNLHQRRIHGPMCPWLEENDKLLSHCDADGAHTASNGAHDIATPLHSRPSQHPKTATTPEKCGFEIKKNVGQIKINNPDSVK